VPITLVTGPANAGKAQVVMDAVRRELAHGEEPLLIVPTRADAEHYLRELAGDGVAMGVRVERFAGLIGEAVKRAGVAEPLLGGAARERVLEAVAARAGAPSTRGYLSALAELFAQLLVRRLTPARLGDALSRLREADGPGAHAHDLGLMFADYEATLERLGRVDEERRAIKALDALRERPALWGRTPVLFYGFDDLTRLQLDAIETFGRVVDAPVTVSLSYEPARVAFAGRAESFHALVPLAREHHQLPARSEHYTPHARAALAHLERSLFEPDAARIDSDGALRLLEGGGERAELELVAGEIAELLRQGLAPGEIAVLVRRAGTSPEMLEEVFSAAGIPFALARRTRFADTAIGGALIGLLRCVPAGGRPPEPAPPRPPAGALQGAPAQTRTGGVEDLLAWLRAPGVLEQPALADRLELAARRAGAADAAAARALWEERNWPLEAIDRLFEAQARGPLALCERAARELYWLFCAPRRGGARVLEADELEDAGALAVGRRALAELRELARGAPELAPAEAGELAHALSRLEVVGGEGAAGDAVAVLDPLALRARRVCALFACGLQEGVFPAPARPHALLSEDERRRVAEVSGLRLGEDADSLAAERYLFYAALSRPQERLFLSWHVADDEGEAMSRSLFVDDVCDLFEPELMSRRARRALGSVDGPAGAAPGASALLGRATRADPRAVQPLSDERLLAWLRERVWSASSLEKWIGCPVGWFVERMLDPEHLDPDPEPLARGALAHAALKDTLEALRRERGTARLTLASLARARELLAIALADNEAEHPLSVAPERRMAVRRRLHVDLERYLRHAAEVDSPLEPSALELGFGFAEGDERGGASDLPALELGGGVRLRGRIDRVDVGERGEAVVYDYKGGRAPAGARWIRDASLQVALYMRAVEDLLHLRVVGGFYQPLTGEDLRARGALDGDAGLELDCVGPDVYEHAEMRELLEQALALARAATAEAGRGELQPRPHTCAFRGGCMYPSICRCER